VKRGKMANGLVWLSAVAIASVFGVGYMQTRPSADALLGQVSPLSSPASAAPGTAIPDFASPTPLTRGSGRFPATPPGSAPAARATPTPLAQAGTYKDGTYTGVGSSRHGSVQATVVIESGQIRSAEITRCGTRYPCSQVARLVSEVVTRQSAPVDYVSGATDSSIAYRPAVASALAKAV